MMIKFMKRYGNLVETDKDNRAYVMGLSLKVKDSNVKLTIKKE
jgi:hypothetical protein